MDLLWNSESFQMLVDWLTFHMHEHVLDMSAFYQLLATLLSLSLAFFATRSLKKLSQEFFASRKINPSLIEVSDALMFPVLWLIFQWTLVVASAELSAETFFTRLVASLLTAWVVIRFVAGFVRDPLLSKAVAVTAWTVAALDIVGLLHPALVVLDHIALNVGDLHLSVLSLLKGALSLMLLLWGALSFSRLIEQRIKTYTQIEASLRVLFSKFVKVSFVVMALFVAVGSMGIDMSAFAVFGGAIGVGIGFGLQKVVSNLICGVILLLDRSIKPGDVVALDAGNTYGVVNRLSGRCVSIRTRSGKEHLIPNEDFITQKVENWSYSDNNVRLHLPVGVSYDSDVRQVSELLLQSVEQVARVLQSPKPAVRLLRFGDHSIDFELRVWIRDPKNGLNNVRSEVNQNIWELFQKHGVEIPYPQRDVHVKSIAQNAPAG